MITDFDRSCVEIDLDAIANNMREVRRITSPNAQILAVVKADSYGHGAYETSKVFLENGADGLSVATIDEAISLRKKGIEHRILLLGGMNQNRVEDAINYHIDLSVYDYDQALVLSNECRRLNSSIDIHIKLDTGMGRIGFLEGESSVDTIIKICNLPGLNPYGIFSHLSSADTEDDEYTRHQFDIFMNTIEELKKRGIVFKRRHICNSSGIMRFPDMHLDMVRAGIVLYGLMPPGCPEPTNKINLIPAMTWISKAAFIKDVKAGTSIGYSRKFIAKRDTKVLTVQVGYADGLSRRFSNGFELLVNSQRAPIIGNVCMDMCMLDVTDIKGDIKVGDNITIFGKERLPDELAEVLGTINYEITCDVGKRVKRIFVNT